MDKKYCSVFTSERLLESPLIDFSFERLSDDLLDWFQGQPLLVVLFPYRTAVDPGKYRLINVGVPGIRYPLRYIRSTDATSVTPPTASHRVPTRPPITTAMIIFTTVQAVQRFVTCTLVVVVDLTFSLRPKKSKGYRDFTPHYMFLYKI